MHPRNETHADLVALWQAAMRLAERDAWHREEQVERGFEGCFESLSKAPTEQGQLWDEESNEAHLS